MRDVVRDLLRDPASWFTVLGVTLGYLILFQFALGDLAMSDRMRGVSGQIARTWPDLLFQQRGLLRFEPIAMLKGPFFTWTISPINIAIGVVLGGLIGGQIALARYARTCARACGLHPATGMLAGLPGLLAGGACCAPTLGLLLGLQMTSGLLTLSQWLIPIAFVLVAIGFGLTLRVVRERCAGSVLQST